MMRYGTMRNLRMIVKINEDGMLVIEAMTETEGYALLKWWDGFFTKKNTLRKTQTTMIQIEWPDAEPD